MASDLGLDGTFRARYASQEEPAAVAKRLNALGEVAWAEPNRFREASIIPDDPQFASQWGLTRIGCPDAWDHTTGAPSVVVAIVDTGVDLNHSELAGLLVAGQDLVDFPPDRFPRLDGFSRATSPVRTGRRPAGRARSRNARGGDGLLCEQQRNRGGGRGVERADHAGAGSRPDP